jgi:hypothetical protein
MSRWNFDYDKPNISESFAQKQRLTKSGWWFTATYAISIYHYWCGFNLYQGEVDNIMW